MISRLIFIDLWQSWTELVLTLLSFLMRRVTKSGRIAKKKYVTHHQDTLVIRFPSLFRGQATESLLSLVLALMDRF
jgi:hypothetical protein